MTRRIFMLMPGLLLIMGCQADKGRLPWFSSHEPMYSASQLASMDNAGGADQPGVQAGQQWPGSEQGNGSPASLVSNTSGAVPDVSQLVQSGRSAIQRSGSGDPMVLQEARGYFEQALSLDGSSGPAHHGLAIVADLQQDWMTAEQHYKQALSQKPQDASLLNDLGYSYLLQNRYHEASRYLGQALQVSPRHERAHINLALLGLKRGDRASAEARLATIYSPAEVQNTLTQLQADVNQLPINSGAAIASQQPLQNWPPGNTMSPGTPHPVPPMTAPGATVAGQYPATAVSRPSSGQRAADNRPVSVYPPGILPEGRTTVAQAPLGNVPAAVAPVASPQTATSAHNYSAPVAPPLAAANTITGVPVGNVIHVPGQGGVVQHPLYPNGGPGPQSVATGVSTVPASVAGLNTGPGNLFPIPPQGVIAGQPPIASGQPVGSAPAHGQPLAAHQVSQPNHFEAAYPVAAQPLVVQPQPQYQQPQYQQPQYQQPQYQQPQYQQPQYQQPQYQQPQYQQPQYQQPQYQQPQPQSAQPNPVHMQPVQVQPPQPQVQYQQPAMTPSVQVSTPYQATAPSVQHQPASQPLNVMGVSGQFAHAPVQTAALPQTMGRPAMSMPNVVAPPVPTASAPGGPGTSPLAAYERQLELLDNQYRQQIQQMNGRAVPATGAIPRQ